MRARLRSVEGELWGRPAPAPNTLPPDLCPGPVGRAKLCRELGPASACVTHENTQCP